MSKFKCACKSVSVYIYLIVLFSNNYGQKIWDEWNGHCEKFYFMICYVITGFNMLLSNLLLLLMKNFQQIMYATQKFIHGSN